MIDHSSDAASQPAEESPRYFYPNRMGRILLLSIEDVLGRNPLTLLLSLAGYPDYANMPPPGTTDRQFPFEVVSSLTRALLDLYGPRSGRGVAMRVGRMCFKHGIREYGPMMGVGELAFQLLPLSMKLEKGGRALADLFNNQTDQVVRLQETPDTLYWHVDRCGQCWGIQASQPCCLITVGLLQEALLWVSGGKTFQVEEQACKACGDECCTIAITKKPLD